MTDMTKVPSPLHPEPNAPLPQDQDADLFDYAAMKLWSGFVWRSLGRHRVAGILTGLVMLGMTAFLLWVFPKQY